MTTATRAPKRGFRYEAVADDLRQQIRSGRLAIGDGVPTVAALSSAYSVSRVTAHRALRALATEGLIEIRRGPRGAIVKRDHVRPSVRHRTFVSLLRPTKPPNPLDNFALEMIQAICDEMARRGLWRMPVSLGEEDVIERVAEGVAEAGARGVLVDQKTPRPIIEAVADLGAPVVVFNRVLDAPGVTCICPDYERLTFETIQRFRRRGFEQLGFFYVTQFEGGVTEAWLAAAANHLAMRSAFARQAVEAGYAAEDVLMMPIETIVDGVRQPPTYGLPAYRPKTWRPMGILALIASGAHRLGNELRERGYVPGRDFEAVGAVEVESSRWIEHPPSAWRIELDPLARETVDALERLAHDPKAPPEVRRTPVTFLDRGAHGRLGSDDERRER